MSSYEDQTARTSEAHVRLLRAANRQAESLADDLYQFAGQLLDGRASASDAREMAGRLILMVERLSAVEALEGALGGDSS